MDLSNTASDDPELRLALSFEQNPEKLASIPWPWLRRERLYDLENDAEEREDVAHRFPDVVDTLRSRLDAYLDQAPPKDYDPGSTPQCDSQERAHPHDGPDGCASETPWCVLNQEAPMLV